MSSRKLLIRNYNENKKSRQCFEGLLVNHVLLTNSLCAVTYQFTRFSLATLIVHQSVDRSTNPFHHGLLVSSLWWKGFMERQSNGRWKWQEQNWWTGCDVWSEVKCDRDDEKRQVDCRDTKLEDTLINKPRGSAARTYLEYNEHWLTDVERVSPVVVCDCAVILSDC